MSSPEGTFTRVAVRDAPEVAGLVFRMAGPGDWDALADVLNRSRRSDGVDEVHSGEDLRSEHEPLDAFELGRDILVAEIDGAVVGYGLGSLHEREGVLVAETSGAVVAEHRHRGIGTAIWGWQRDRLVAAAAADERQGTRELRTWAQDVELADIALFADQGYVPIRFGFEMRRFLTGSLPTHSLPAGIELRPVTPDQHRAIFDADSEAFEDHWGHRAQTDGDFVARFEHPDTNPALWSVAWDGNEVAGVVMTAIFGAENEVLGLRRGWLEHVSVRRPWRGRGVAKALCADAFRILREQGMDEAWLGVDGTNRTGALGLYEGLGFNVVRRWQAYGRPMDRPAPVGWTSGSGPEAGRNPRSED